MCRTFSFWSLHCADSRNPPWHLTPDGGDCGNSGCQRNCQALGIDRWVEESRSFTPDNLLRDVEVAMARLKHAFELEPRLREKALEDADLKAAWVSLGWGEDCP